MFWDNANFTIGSVDESIALWRKIEPAIQEERKLIYAATHLYKLFVVNSPTMQIKIIAGSAHMSKTYV
jgi:hypothetical protein